ncbi:DUF6880 family protein [Variovorax sp. YR216]|uniref:DUF6880 family protein n=1 Tax=Variovorax sp. YR216 TaxID=1882828 RepID=UPI00089634FF|nr:DUF6880 family protein [Variovorax sp. YR216]SEB22655.1 hypothetical protein SAMN05444680_116116 [Variovorax sp. YR216]
MPKIPAESLEAFLHRLPASTLAAVLLEMAEVDEMVKERLLRLQLADRPDQLAAGFRKTLISWQRSTKYYNYRDAPAYGQMLKAWLDQVGRELVPKDPAAGLALFETFIEADEVWFEHADDSGADIGEAVRSACRHWLQAAALCETPANVWLERLMRLYLADDYGAREELLRSANRLLPAPALRTLIARFESQMTDVLSGASKSGDLPHEVHVISAALSLLSEALGDPDVMVRAVLSYSPQPNGLQRASFVEAYLRPERPDDALTWLREPWADREDDRRSLLARVLERLGRFKESVPIRRQAFKSSPSVFYLQCWFAHLPDNDRAEAEEEVRQLILNFKDPVTAASLLVELGDIEAAEARLVAEADRLSGEYYGSLEPLTKAFRMHACWRGETVAYRALLLGILNRAYAKAYHHGARYLARLGEIAASGPDLKPMKSHETFVAEIRLRHGRKSAFWAQVESRRNSVSDTSGGSDEGLDC